MNFKIGDWVRTYDNLIYTLTQIYGEDEECELDGVCIELLSNIELWQPKEGEWCLFSHYEIAEYATLSRFKECMYGTDGYTQYVNEQNCVYDRCEPFIGTLPTFIKDKE